MRGLNSGQGWLGWVFVTGVGDPGQVDLDWVPGNMARAECGGGEASLGFWLPEGRILLS